MNQINQYKSIFLSDIHLGFAGCQNERLASFLDQVDFNDLYLVGDIVDFWSMQDNFFWPETHQKILDKFVDYQQKGKNVRFITGNHDDPLRESADTENLKAKGSPYPEIIGALSSFKISEKEVLQTKKHGKMLVIHGDQYDVVTSNAKWLSKFGGILYDLLIYLNRPLSKFLKRSIKKIVNKAGSFHKLVRAECKTNGYDALMCGHIHIPEIHKFKDYSYINTGDWVESCTAVVEDFDGDISLIELQDDNSIKILATL